MTVPVCLIITQTGTDLSFKGHNLMVRTLGVRTRVQAHVWRPPDHQRAGAGSRAGAQVSTAMGGAAWEQSNKERCHGNCGKPSHGVASSSDGRDTLECSSGLGARVAINTCVRSPGASHGVGQTLTARVLAVLQSRSSTRTRLWPWLCNTSTATL